MIFIIFNHWHKIQKKNIKYLQIGQIGYDKEDTHILIHHIIMHNIVVEDDNKLYSNKINEKKIHINFFSLIIRLGTIASFDIT